MDEDIMAAIRAVKDEKVLRVLDLGRSALIIRRPADTWLKMGEHHMRWTVVTDGMGHATAANWKKYSEDFGVEVELMRGVAFIADRLAVDLSPLLVVGSKGEYSELDLFEEVRRARDQLKAPDDDKIRRGNARDVEDLVAFLKQRVYSEDERWLIIPAKLGAIVIDTVDGMIHAHPHPLYMHGGGPESVGKKRLKPGDLDEVIAMSASVAFEGDRWGVTFRGSEPAELHVMLHRSVVQASFPADEGEDVLAGRVKVRQEYVSLHTSRFRASREKEAAAAAAAVEAPAARKKPKSKKAVA